MSGLFGGKVCDISEITEIIVVNRFEFLATAGVSLYENSIYCIVNKLAVLDEIYTLDNGAVAELGGVRPDSSKVRHKGSRYGRIVKSHYRNISADFKTCIDNSAVTAYRHFVVCKNNSVDFVVVFAQKLSDGVIAVFRKIAVAYLSCVVFKAVLDHSFSVNGKALLSVLISAGAADKGDILSVMVVNDMLYPLDKSR